MSAGAAVTVRVPAKINLGLVVGGARADGYHELATVFHAVSLYDHVSAAPAADGRSARLTVCGPRAAGVPTGEGNLALRAARLLAERTGVAPGVDLRLVKGIPVAGGMAGGSADAAGALVACDLLWRTGLSREQLLALAAELGSDVPFALVGGTVVGAGRGERLTSAMARGSTCWVLAVTQAGLSTPRVYAEADRLRAGASGAGTPSVHPRVPLRLMQALSAGDTAALGRALCNDLQQAACSLAPHLGAVLAAGRRAGALGGVVSGSGPTVAFLVRDAAAAAGVAAAVRACAQVTGVERVQGPVPGACRVQPVTAGGPGS